jgi:hypothetical protein
MGFIALALASAPPYRLLSPATAALRIRAGLQAVLERLPHDRGVVPHFVHSATGAVFGADCFSTVETAWLAAGALWAAAFLREPALTALAERFYDRIDWLYWSVAGDNGPGLLQHGKGRDGRFLGCSWDRINGETVFMYVLAAGAPEGRAVSPAVWAALEPFYGTVAGHRFHSADLGLFVFQYGLDLLDVRRWWAPGPVDLWSEAQVATRANHEACRGAAASFATYRRYWGLSAGDGPGTPSGEDIYRCYTPSGPIDGTAHLTATLAAVVHEPAAVMENLHEAQHERRLTVAGRYGFSNLNLDRHWVSRDVVGIDLGAAVLALDNHLMDNRVRDVFGGLNCVRRGLERLGFVQVADRAEMRPTVRQAS